MGYYLICTRFIPYKCVWLISGCSQAWDLCFHQAQFLPDRTGNIMREVLGCINTAICFISHRFRLPSNKDLSYTINWLYVFFKYEMAKEKEERPNNKLTNDRSFSLSHVQQWGWKSCQVPHSSIMQSSLTTHLPSVYSDKSTTIVQVFKAYCVI